MKKLLAKTLIGDVVEKHETKASFDTVIQKLTKVIKDNDFTIVATHDLKCTYKKKNLEIDDDFEYQIVQICNAKKSHKVLTSMSFDLGIMMPKSIIVSRKNGITTLRFMKMKPWMVSMMFPDIDIAPMAKMVSKIMKKIVLETIQEAQK
jgi:uncharacterized protein (DUF302 family)